MLQLVTHSKTYRSSVAWVAESTNATSQLQILAEQRHALAVHTAQVGIFEQSNHVLLSAGLKCLHGESSPSDFLLEVVLADLFYEALERSSWKQIVCVVLQLPDFVENMTSNNSLPIFLLSEEERVNSSLTLYPGGFLAAGYFHSRVLESRDGLVFDG